MNTTSPTDRPGNVGMSMTGPSRLFRGTLLASASLTIMAAAIISPSLPEMRQVFADVPAADVLVRLSLTITSLAIGITAMLAGAIADRVGRKPVLVTSLLLYAVAGVAGYFTTDLPVLLGTRALLGIAVGGIMSAVSAMITDLFEGPRRAAFLGLQAATASLGGVIFLPLAGALAGASWKAPFWIYAASLLILPFAIAGVRETRVQQLDASGPTYPRHTTDGQPAPTGLIAVIYGLALVGTLVFFMAPTQLPFLLQRFDVSSTVVGVVIAGSTASSAIAGVAYARVRRSLGQATITALSLAALGIGWIVVGASASVTQIMLGVLIGGIGVGLIIPNLNLWLSELVPAARRGRVLGGLVSAIFLGQFLSPLLLQPLVSGLGLAPTFVISGGATVLGALAVAIALRRTQEVRR